MEEYFLHYRRTKLKKLWSWWAMNTLRTMVRTTGTNGVGLWEIWWEIVILLFRRLSMRWYIQVTS